MEDKELQHIIAERLQQDWELQLPDLVSEEALLELLAVKVSRLIEKDPEAFFQLMYRLDIPEKKLNLILFDQDAVFKIARMIYDRQLQKIQSRKQGRNNSESIDKELEW
jgi:hypothetical protein